jgi:N,N'-diacetyllegionaminate synthase
MLDKNRVLIIAEAGVNHNGDLNLAKKMIDAASEAEADAIKFQTFKADKLVSRTAPKAGYQIASTGLVETQFEMIKKLELDLPAHQKLQQYCKVKNILFLSTPFDLESIDLLEKLGLPLFKIPSGEITNLPYLRKIASYNKPVIMSSGMADLGEIEDALNVLTSKNLSYSQITILHCNTEYPTSFQHVNLKAMQTISNAFPGVKIGYSDHTMGIVIPIAAAALGASVIEKHFTLDNSMNGPDHKASLEPQELKSMVQSIRSIEIAMGKGIKYPNQGELKNKHAARKSIVAACEIKKGETLNEQNMTVKRPGTGISPMRWNEVKGIVAVRDFKPDELIVIH